MGAREGAIGVGHGANGRIGPGPRAGAIAYNVVHNLAGPLALALAGLMWPPLVPYALVWVAHIAADRVLGYGLR